MIPCYFLNPRWNAIKGLMGRNLERNPENSLLIPWLSNKICFFWAGILDFEIKSKSPLPFSLFSTLVVPQCLHRVQV